MNLQNRIERLERKTGDNNKDGWRPILYRDAYTLEERGRLDGHVYWIVENRSPDVRDCVSMTRNTKTSRETLNVEKQRTNATRRVW